MDNLTAFGLASVLWASVGLLAFKRKSFYLGFCVAVLLAAGTAGLEYCPFLWCVPEFVFIITDIFNAPSRLPKSS